MTDRVKWLKSELRKRYERALRSPMNWRMIDAIVTLEEADERKKSPPTADSTPNVASTTDNSQKA